MVAEGIFEREPYEDVTMEGIAAGAGVSPALVHHYFGSKRDVFMTLVERAISGFQNALAPPLVDAGKQGPPAQRLAEALARYLDFVTEHPNGYAFVIGAHGAPDSEIRRRTADTRVLAHRVVLAIVGLDRPTAAQELAAWGWIGFVEASVTRWLRDPEGTTRAELEALLLKAAAASFVA